MIVVYFGWVIFKFESMGDLGTVLKGMFGFAKGGFTSMEVTTLFVGHIFFLIFAIVAVTPFGKWLRRYVFDLGKKNPAVFSIASFVEAVTPVVLLVLSALSLIGDSYNPFLYFQF